MKIINREIFFQREADNTITVLETYELQKNFRRRVAWKIERKTTFSVNEKEVRVY